MSEVLGGLLLILVVALGILLAIGKAVLVYEERLPVTYFPDRYRCTYFTGLRTVDHSSGSSLGCPRFKDI